MAESAHQVATSTIAPYLTSIKEYDLYSRHVAGLVRPFLIICRDKKKSDHGSRTSSSLQLDGASVTKDEHLA